MLNRLSIDVHHEGLGSDGAVGWIYAVNNFPKKLIPMVMNRRRNISVHGFNYIINNPEKLSLHRFCQILHQVRHPLRVINTIVSKCSNWDRYWKWISRQEGFSVFSESMGLGAKRRAMLLYILWNKHIEMYADIRYYTH